MMNYNIGMFLKDYSYFVPLGVIIFSSAWYILCWQSSCIEEDKEEKKDNIGKRGNDIIKMNPLHSYMKGFLEALKNPCDPMLNPEGYICLCIAENRLVQEKLAHRLMSPSVSISGFSNSIVYNYNTFLGLPEAREYVAWFLQRFFLQMNNKQLLINSQHIIIGSGASGLLSHLFYALAEEGDAVLIPAPYYAKFENDMSTIAKLHPIPVYSKCPTLGPTRSDLDKALHDAKRKGFRPRILLLNNPNNPLGVIYPPHIMFDAVEWSQKNEIHVIVNEIYALSTHENSEHGFKSILSILYDQFHKHVHFIYALSKDFGAGGFRVGMLYTQNMSLINCLANLNTFSAVSQPMQFIVADLLHDQEFLNYYLNESRIALQRSYQICVRKFNEMVIDFVPASAGCFIYVDFSSLLPSKNIEGELQFLRLIQDVARVILTPGTSMRDCKPGWFRVCYAWVNPQILEIALERLSYLVTKIRKTDWQDLMSTTNLDQVSKNVLRKKSSFMNVMEWSTPSFIEN